MKEVTLIMTQKQINRYHIIKDSLESKLTVAEAATHLGISERHVTRLRNGVKEEGAAFMIHKNKGKPSTKTVSDEEKQKIQELYRSEIYNGANFQHFTELITTHNNIKRSYSTIRTVLLEGGIKSPKTRRRYKPHRTRKRKAQEGLMIQMDATPFEWFGGKTKFALHGAIDDATGKFIGAYMTKNECLLGYFETIRQVIEENGVPISAYADRHTIFQSPKTDKLTIAEQLDGKVVNDTQFGRAMKELSITLIAARSPQAKGRIERLWGTLQSRLPIEFRIHNITKADEANAFLRDYIPKFNDNFAVKPENSESAYAPLAKDLDAILCVKEKRSMDNGGVFSFKGKLFKVVADNLPGKANIEVMVSPTRGIMALYKGKAYDVLPHTKPNKTRIQTPDKKTPPTLGHRAHNNWKNNLPRYSFDLNDSEIYKMLEDIFLSKYA